METSKSLTYISVAVISIIVAFYAAFSPSPSRAMEELQLGGTYQDMIAIAGNPSYEADGTLGPEFKKTNNQIIKGCVKEAWYEPIIFKFMPSKYAFCFDKNGILLKELNRVGPK